MQTKLREEIEQRDAKLVNFLVSVPKQSQPVTPVSPVEGQEDDDDPDAILIKQLRRLIRNH